MAPSSSSSSSLFGRFKKCGVITDGVVIKINQLGDKLFVCASVGDAFQVYRYDNLAVCFTSSKLPTSLPIRSFDIYGQHTYVCAGSCIYVFDRAELKQVFELEHTVLWQMILGKVMLLLDESNSLTLIDVKSNEIVSSIRLTHSSQAIRLFHPDSYVNKVLVAYADGELELWNFNSSKLIYSFQAHKSSAASGATISTIAKSPYPDVVSLGMSSGQILFLNLKTDKIVLSCSQSSHAVTCISFRSDLDNSKPIVMASTTTDGKLRIWNINTHQPEKFSHLIEMKHDVVIHDRCVTTAQFLDAEPILMTSSQDNSIKLWIFDNHYAAPRLLKHTSGFTSFPSRMKFRTSMSKYSGGAHANHSNCEMIVADFSGKLNYASIIMDSKHKPFSTKNMPKHNHYEKKLPRIIDFDFSDQNGVDWGDLVTIHKDHHYAYIWNSASHAITTKILHPPLSVFRTHNFNGNTQDHASSVSVSSCGHFCVIGYRSGLIYKYNLQSATSKGVYPQESNLLDSVGHNQAVTGVLIDMTNTWMISCGLDGQVMFWDFASHTVISKKAFSKPWTLMRGNKYAGFVALVNQTNDIQVYDIYTHTLVREFIGGHARNISDVIFSPDNRSILSSSLDSTLRVWDFPTGRCLAWLKFDSAITSLAISPTSEYLCVGLFDKPGFEVYIDKGLYENVYPSIEPTMPTSVDWSLVKSQKIDVASVPPNDFQKTGNNGLVSKDNLMTLSSMPRIYYTNLFFLELIRQRNLKEKKPIQQSDIPFFLSDLGKTKEPSTMDKNTPMKSRILRDDQDDPLRSGLASRILSCHAASKVHQILNIDNCFQYLLSLSSAGVDLELQKLCHGNDDQIGQEILCSFLCYLHVQCAQEKNFEVLQAILFRTLANFENVLAQQPQFSMVTHLLHSDLVCSCDKLRTLLEANICLLRVFTENI